MKSRIDLWWKKIKEHPVSSIIIFIAIIVVIALIIVIILGYHFDWDWTGLGPYTPPNSNFQRGKTLWDWLQLLIIPAILAIAGFAFTSTISQNERRATEQRSKTERDIALDNQREVVIQDYIDKISELLLNGNLAEKKEDGQLNPEYKQALLVARVRTITILTQLDARRISYVFAFLREAELMSATNDNNAISLHNADLHGVDWSQADLHGIDLRGANLSGANLSGAIFFNKVYAMRAFGGPIPMSRNCTNLSRADLRGADVSGVDLSGVDLSGANLSGADLRGSKVTDGQLAKAASLKDTTMPDGTIHP